VLRNPAFWVIVGLGAIFLLLLVEVVLLARHLNKVDDLAHRLNDDLAVAEEKIVRLEAKTVRLPGQRLSTLVQPVSDTQHYGRHARKG